MLNRDEMETRVLEYLDGELGSEQERALLAEAERDPELKALLEEYRAQERLLNGYFAREAAAAGHLAKPDLSTLPAAEKSRAGFRPARWLAAAAAVGIMAVSGALLMRQDGNPSLGTVARVDGAAFAFNDGQTTELKPQAAIQPTVERIKTPTGSGLEIAMAAGGRLELNQNSTVRFMDGGRSAEVMLERGEIIVHETPAVIRTPWFAAEADNAAFSVIRGLRGAEVAVVSGTVEIRSAGTRRQVRAGESWSNTGSRTVAVADRVGWSHHAEQLVAGLPESKPVLPVVQTIETTANLASVSFAPQFVSVRTTDFLPSGTVGILEIADVDRIMGELQSEDLSELSGKLRNMVMTGIDDIQMDDESRARMKLEVSAFLDNEGLNLALSSFRGSLSIGATLAGPLVVAEVTDNYSAVDQLINVSMREHLGLIPGETNDKLRVVVVGGFLVAGFHHELVEATVEAIRHNEPTAYGNSAFVRDMRAAAGEGSPLIAASDIQSIFEQSPPSPRNAQALERMGWLNLSSIIAAPNFHDDTNNRALQVRFDGERRGLMSWLAAPGPLTGLEFFSPDTHVLTAARIEKPAIMLQQMLAWHIEQSGAVAAEIEANEQVRFLNTFAATLGNEVAVGLDNPILPVPNLKIVVELVDPIGFHDSMLQWLDIVSANLPDGQQITAETSMYRNYLIVDLQMPGKPIGLSYAVVDDHVVFGPGRPFLQAAIDTSADRRSIDQESAFVESLPAKSGSYVSWLLYMAHNESLNQALPYLGQVLASRGVGVDLGAVGNQVAGGSMVFYAIAEQDRVEFYLNGIDGEFGMTSILPSVTEWLSNGQ